MMRVLCLTILLAAVVVTNAAGPPCAQDHSCTEKCAKIIANAADKGCDLTSNSKEPTCTGLKREYKLFGCDINECASSPCQNGGTCSDFVNFYTCNCAVGFTGGNCQTNINECASSPCQNGGTCSDFVNSYTCNCAVGFTGGNCQTNINECVSNPCMNGGTCIDGVNSYTCNCAGGFTGVNCQTTPVSCVDNGGVCVSENFAYIAKCISNLYEYDAGCNPGFKCCKSFPCVNYPNYGECKSKSLCNNQEWDDWLCPNGDVCCSFRPKLY